jgi:hypothetical protein
MDGLAVVAERFLGKSFGVSKRFSPERNTDGQRSD